MNDATELAAYLEALLDTAIDAITESTAQVIAATKVMDHGARLLSLITIRNEIDDAIRELVGAQPEPVA